MSGAERERLRQVQIGTLDQLPHPALVPYDTSRPWLMVHDDASLPLAAQVCEGVALQLLAQHAPDHARLYLFESAPSPNFAQIKRLLAASHQRWGQHLLTVRDCLKHLTELEELTHRRFALLAQAEVADIHAYNAAAAHAEPVIYLLISSLASALSETQALRQLAILCEQGPAVGIIPLLLNNTEGKVSQEQLARDFWQTAKGKPTGLDLRASGPRMRSQQPLNIPADLWTLLLRFGLRLGCEALHRPWVEQLLAAAKEAAGSTGKQDFLQVPIGLDGLIPVCFSLGDASGAYHALIGGTTGTGKTTLLNNLLINACETYSPDELQLTLMDFKNGVSFWDYAGVAHVVRLYVPGEDQFTEAVACLQQFERQIDPRMALFRTARVTCLADFNRQTKQRLPRALLVVDEAQSLFEGRDYQQKAAVKRLISHIAKQGRAAGLHIILSTQSFQNLDLEADAKDQFHLRIGFHHATAMGCRALMGRDNDAMLDLPQYTVIYNSHQGEESKNRRVRLNDLPDFRVRLDALKARFPGTPQTTPKPDCLVTIILTGR